MLTRLNDFVNGFTKRIGLGKMPRVLREEAQSEGLRLLDESVAVIIRYRKYRSRGTYFGNKRHGWTGFVALTDRRIMCSGYSSDYFSLELTPANARLLDVSADPDELRLGFEASDFYQERKGRVDARYRTPKARVFAEHINAMLEDS